MRYNLDQIAHDIGNFCAKWGRIHVSQTKEKYSSVRVYCSFGVYNLHSLIYPRYIYKHKNFPQWLWNLDCKILYKFFEPLSKFIIPYQNFIYKLSYMIQVWKYPHLFDKITNDMDWPEKIGYLIPTLCPKHQSGINRYYTGKSNSCDVCNLRLENNKL